MEHKLYLKQFSENQCDCRGSEPGQLGASHQIPLLRHSSLLLSADHIFLSISEEMLNQ